MKLATNTEKITHLLYADAVLVMEKAFSRNARILKKIFKTYCRWTGQAVNLQKSMVIFGKTVSALSTEAIWFQKESKYTKHIWLKKLKLDQKVYLLWWRTLNGDLPTMEWLCHRKLSDSKECPRDCHENENTEHVIVKCKRLKALLQELRRSGFNVPEFHNMEECNKDLEQNSGKGLVKIFAVAVFCSWKSRNLTKHGNAEIPLAYAVAEIISHSSHLHSDPIEKNWHTNQHLLSKSWCPPPHGWIKLNVDATLSVNNMAGIAGVLRDYNERLLCAYGKKLIHWDIAHLEFKAIMSFGNYIQNWFYEYNGIIIEGDNVNIMKMIQDSINLKTNKGTKPDLSFLQVFNKVVFLFANRECNRSADFCAKYVLLGDFCA
ncbi:uncharacterized protein LOC110114824, partial [Dendrobium catenatum]|uniref:uncharacterized protein LOC110114824 n=1 Tax=Dendrobium catenatum TaxID=906689 RepID=UPI0009F174D8